MYLIHYYSFSHDTQNEIQVKYSMWCFIYLFIHNPTYPFDDLPGVVATSACVSVCSAAPRQHTQLRACTGSADTKG